MYMDESLPMFGFSMNRFSDWLWSMNAPRSAAMSIRGASGSPTRCGRSRAGAPGCSSMPCTEPSANLIAVAHRLGPQTELLQLVDQVTVHLQEVARQRLALEQVRHLRLDALVAAGDRGDGRRRRDGDRGASCAGRRLVIRSRSASQRRFRRWRDVPGVELQLTVGRTRLANAGCAPSRSASSLDADSAWK